MALASRTELAQSRIQVQNQEVTIRGSRKALLPSVSAVANFTNDALAGQANALPGAPHNNRDFFVGGYDTVLSQLFR